MRSGEIEKSLERLETAVETIARAARTGRAGWRPHGHPPRRDWRRPARWLGTASSGPLRRPRRHCRHPVRVAVRARDANAAPHRVGGGEGQPFPPDRPARVLAQAGHWSGWLLRACAAMRCPRSSKGASTPASTRPSNGRRTAATRCSSQSTSTLSTPAWRRGPAPPSPVALLRGPCSTPCDAAPWSSRSRHRRCGAVPAVRPRGGHRLPCQQGRAGSALGPGVAPAAERGRQGEGRQGEGLQGGRRTPAAPLLEGRRLPPAPGPLGASS